MLIIRNHNMEKDILNIHNYFTTPVWSIDKPEWVEKINNACDKHIKFSQKNLQKLIKDREVFFKKKVGDHGLSYHSGEISRDPDLKVLVDYVGNTSQNLLDQMGYDMKHYKLFFTEFWVQEFAKKAGGYHDTHVHWDNHISGFYFLKCSDKTSRPVYTDPRPGAVMSKLTLKNPSDITYGTTLIHNNPKPGTLVFFPAYLPHQFTLDDGIEPFRFIHFNLQAIRKTIVNGIKSGL
tara:strand:- start:502 stop:1206 length:705 start_codon:yes stop_codon:yes gene_type:complete